MQSDSAGPEVRVAARLAALEEVVRLKLQEEPFLAIVRQLGPLGQPAGAFEFLSQITIHAESSVPLANLCASIPSEAGQNAVERALLLLASQHALPQVAGLPVNDSVKRLFADEFQFFSNPPASGLAQFQADHVRYGEMARIATLRRFPAGQFHWEVSAIPRSWIAKARRPLQALAHVVGRMGGFAPVLELHLNARRKNRLVLLEKEADLSYYRAARAIEKQPSARGLTTSSWLYCENTAKVTPRMAWLRQTPQAGGALLVEIGPAPEDSGFMTGSEERRKLYEDGVYQPKVVLVLWPRKALIAWANQHPEFDESVNL